MRRVLVLLFPLTIILVFTTGVGLSHVSSFDSENSIGSDYCSISSGEGAICFVTVLQGVSSPYLGFSSDGAVFQETISLDYINTKGTDVVLTIVFSCLTTSDDPVIKCISNEKTVGSTSLTGEGTKTGTIAGVVLPVSKDGTGNIYFKFHVEGIDLNTPVQMSFSVHPLEVSS